MRERWKKKRERWREKYTNMTKMRQAMAFTKYKRHLNALLKQILKK